MGVVYKHVVDTEESCSHGCSLEDIKLVLKEEKKEKLNV